jgi:PucR family transcriptional regulator, purine catabolism regulatory protein
MVVIESQHDHERDPVVLASEQDRRELVHRLLVEAHVDPAEVALLDYELDAWHLGVIATGAKAAHALEELQMGLGCELLSISHGRSSWAWLGGSRQIKTAALERALSHGRHRDVSFAIGEAGAGIEWWRLTHYQAREAHRVAMYGPPQRLTWYADVPLLATALRDETLAGSLRQKYLAPLRSQKDGGAALRKTLRAYVDAACNVASAASAVGVGRHAIEGRIQTAEQLIGCAIRTRLAELDVALKMEQLDSREAPPLDPSLGS